MHKNREYSAKCRHFSKMLTFQKNTDISAKRRYFSKTLPSRRSTRRALPSPGLRRHAQTGGMAMFHGAAPTRVCEAVFCRFLRTSRPKRVLVRASLENAAEGLFGRLSSILDIMLGGGDTAHPHARGQPCLCRLAQRHRNLTAAQSESMALHCADHRPARKGSPLQTNYISRNSDLRQGGSRQNTKDFHGNRDRGISSHNKKKPRLASPGLWGAGYFCSAM